MSFDVSRTDMLALALGGALVLTSCSRPGSDSAPRQENQHEKEREPEMKRYYLDFDKYQLRGINEVPAPPPGEPYVAVTREQAEQAVHLEVHVGLSKPFLVSYEQVGEGFVKTKTHYDADEPEYGYHKQVCYVTGGAEHCYRYLYARDPGQYHEVPTLYDYRRALPDESQTWLFDIDDPKLTVREEVNFVKDPLPPPLAKRAIAIETTRYVENERRLLAEHTYQRMKGGEPEGDPSVRHEMYNIEKFSRSYLDFVEVLMFMGGRDPAADPG